MEIVSLILSIVSILVAGILTIFEIKNNIKVNDINLEAELSKEIFKKYLTKNIPEAIRNISYNNNCISNIDDLQNALNEFRSELRFYQYCDKDFYNNLKLVAQKIEDYIVENEGKKFDNTDLSAVNEKIVNMVIEFYDVCKNKYKRG